LGSEAHLDRSLETCSVETCDEPVIFRGRPKEEEAAALPVTVAGSKNPLGREPKAKTKTFFRLRAQDLLQVTGSRRRSNLLQVTGSSRNLKTQNLRHGQVETAGCAPSAARLCARVARMHDGTCNAREHG